ncbi:antitoxin Xre/MbcA/ParS toxin-binding domain-containing protein [Pseudomonas frederiksbergensis]|uniref:antitoxin Xre/MbcA/ParS toxin-binding domain-containing protein n=1 Tax=Pseudomonas frederiksbergensis TaxID=104087 RepID=UPI003D24218C
MNYIELVQRQAEQVFGNKAKADLWLNQPKTEFGGSTALEHAHTENGYVKVKDSLERIRHGYSS